MTYIEVVRAAELRAADSTEGIRRQNAFESDGVIVARSRVPRGMASGWHHHGERNLYGYLVAGRLRLEYGPSGARFADVRHGDFFHIPPRLVHRDVNPSRGEDIVVNVLTGEGPTVFNVNGPDSP